MESELTNSLETMHFLADLGNMVAAALDPYGIDVQVDVQTPNGQRTTCSAKASNKVSTDTSDDSHDESQDEAKDASTTKQTPPVSSQNLKWHRRIIRKGGEYASYINLTER